ncbi:MAG: diguanylate cyclase [Alphaproteobacteria bacterium]|nr:diguanylate cyclase [Alphaproteobacteria bacterium]
MEYPPIPDLAGQASERRFRDAFENGPIGMALSTRDGRSVETNRALAAFLGFGAADLAAARENRSDAKDEARAFHAYLSNVVSACCASRFREERCFRRADGAEVWGEVSGMLMPSADGAPEYCFIVIDDITSRKAEQALSERLLAAIDAFSERVVLYDAADRLVFGNRAFREVNKAVSETLAPGTPYETYLRAAVAAGTMPEAAGQEEAWIAWRLDRHRNPAGPFELHRDNGRVMRIHEERLAQGGSVTIATDITEQKQAETALRQTEARLREAALVVGDGFCLLDDDDRILLCNDGFAAVYGADPAGITGRTLESVMRSAHAAGHGFRTGDQDFESWLEALMRERRSGSDITATLQATDGRWFFVRERVSETGEHVMVRSDITALKTLEAELRRLATSDPLTGAANRRFFLERANAEWERFRRYGRPLAVLMLDIDHFKRINDTYGHPVGDEALRALTAAIGAKLRNNDMLGRLGGEEFAVLLPETGLQGAEVMAERLRADIAAIRIDTARGLLTFTTSIGAAVCLDADGNVERGLARADAALYTAKRTGRNRVVIAADGADGSGAADEDAAHRAAESPRTGR